MKKFKVYYLTFILALAILVMYQGCAKEEGGIAAPTESNLGPHPSGWPSPRSANFHGNYIRDNGWSLTICKTCHGGDFEGGTSGLSCYKCHHAPNQANGPESCNNCHGDRHDPTRPFPPRALNGDTLETDRGVGAHYHHLATDTTERYSRRVECIECHEQVNSFNDTSHINPARNGVAQIIFGPLAHTSIGGGITPDPSYNRTSNTCSHVYCHGYFVNGNLNFQPTFNNPESVVCGSCHGDPVTENPNPKPNGTYVPPHREEFTIHTCYQCHSSVIDSSGTIVVPSKHINGIINVYP
jgi:predicted CxxxxCH...CXXCH cytochrome family protein